MADTNIPVMVRVTPEQATKIDEWRRSQPDLPTRPESIRRLSELGLQVAKQMEPAK